MGKSKKSSTKATSAKNYDRNAVELAVRKVLQDDWTVYRAAKHYNVPWSTLKDNVMKSTEHFDVRSNNLTKFEIGKVGRPFALSSDLENKLAKYIIRMQELGFGLTVLQVRKLAYRLAKEQGSAERFDDMKEAAGKKWYRGFRQRFNLTLRRPENLSRYRASCANSVLLEEFYDCLGKVLNEHDLLDKPHQIWNCDETGLMFVTAGSKIVTSIGKKYVYRRVYAEKGTTTTVLCSANAAGKSGPILIIFKGVQNIPALKEGAHLDSMVAVSKKGWITSELFLQWLEMFVKSLPPARPVILIMDSHATHLSPEALKMAEENQIIIVTLPSHTTHLLQPLDVSVYRSLKAAWNNEIDGHMRHNPGKTPSRYDFHSLFNPSYEKSFTPQIIKAGFRKTGISPFNRNAIAPEATMPSTVSERNQTENTQDELSLQIPYCSNPNNIRTTRRKAQSAKVHTNGLAPASNAEAGPSSSDSITGTTGNQGGNNNEDNSTCSVCGKDYAYDIKKNTRAKWIQCCFCLEWFHNKCEDIPDEFDEEVYMCSQCQD